MSEPGVDGAGEPQAMFTASSRALTGGRRNSGPDPTRPVLIAAAGAALIGVVAVLLRHLKVSFETGFFHPQQVGEMAAWAGLGVAAAAAGLWFAYAPRKGLKLKGSHLLAIAAIGLGVTAVVGVWQGLPTAEQRMEYRVRAVAAQTRDDVMADITAFQGEAHALDWVPRVAPDAMKAEQNLPMLRLTIGNADDVINKYKERTAKRRQNVKTLLDVAAPDPRDRIRMQALFEQAAGDLAAQEDRYWDLQAEAVNEGCRLVDLVASLRQWTDAKARGYAVTIDNARFDQIYGLEWQKLTTLKTLIADTVKAIATPKPQLAAPGGSPVANKT